jgi:hypothetical protein
MHPLWLLLPIALVMGSWLHELAHAVAGWLVGAQIHRIDLFSLEVGYAMPPERRWRERALLLAPTMVGVAVAAVAVAAGWRPAWVADWIAIATWAAFVRGSPHDYSLRIARADEWWGSRALDELLAYGEPWIDVAATLALLGLALLVQLGGGLAGPRGALTAGWLSAAVMGAALYFALPAVVAIERRLPSV